MEQTIVVENEEHGGYVRSLRINYQHTLCGTVNTFTKEQAESFKNHKNIPDQVFCSRCIQTFPVSSFVWADTNKSIAN